MDLPDSDPALDGDAVSLAGELDLDTVASELSDVELALERLDDGSYWTDEVDGSPIPDAVLERDPIARRAP